jgi:hypothetical protein
MATNTHPPAKAKTANHASKPDKKSISIRAARYMNDFSIAVTFSTGITQLINFLPLFEKHVKGANLKYFSLERFKQFMVKNGNICWGENEDLIFPAASLFKKLPLRAASSADILYVL